MLTVENKKKYTAEDFMATEEGALFQLIDYNLIKSPAPVPLHQLILAKFYFALQTYLNATENGGVALFAPIDVRLDEGNIYQPDLIYIPEDRIDELIKGRVEGAPDLVVEILSPSNAYYDLRQKKDIYE